MLGRVVSVEAQAEERDVLDAIAHRSRRVVIRIATIGPHGCRSAHHQHQIETQT